MTHIDSRAESSPAKDGTDGPERVEASSSAFLLALRHYLPLVLMVATVVTLVVTYLANKQAASEEDEYRASALIIARTLELRPELLPKTATEIFHTTAVGELAVQLADIPYDPSKLLPHHADIEPVDNSVVIRIIGIDSDPLVAAELANGMAQATIREMNRAGPGVGTFSIQDLANPPVEPVDSIGVPLSAAVGIAAGLVLALGIVGFVVTLVRPILTREQAVRATGVPQIGEIQVPAGSRTLRDPITFLGLGVHIATLDRILVPLEQVESERAIRVAYVSSQKDRLLRGQLVAFIAHEMSNSRETHYLSVDGTRTVWASNLLQLPRTKVTFGTPDGFKPTPGTALVVDGPASDFVDLEQVLPSDTSIVLVVPEGRSRRRVRWMLSQVDRGTVLGFVYLKKIPRWRLGRVWWRQLSITRGTAWQPTEREQFRGALD